MHADTDARNAAERQRDRLLAWVGRVYPRPSGIYARLALLIVAVLGPAFVGTAVLLRQVQQDDRATLERTTVAVARAMVGAIDRRLDSMVSAAQVLATSQRLQRGDWGAFYAQGMEFVALDIGANVVVSDASGRQLLNTLRPLGEALPMHGNPALAQKVWRSGAPAISDLYVGGVLREPVISVDVPVVRDGRMIYLLSVGVLPGRFRDILSAQKLPPGWIGAVFDTTGTIVARTHEHDHFLGSKGSPELVERMAREPEGTLHSTTLEGIAVISAFSRSPTSGWTVALGMPREPLAAEFSRGTRWLAVIVAGILALGLVLAWRVSTGIARPLRRLVEPAAKIGLRQRVVVPPLGLKEADEIGAAIMHASELILRAEHRAGHDALTGLANRRLFLEMVAHEIEACKRYEGHLALLYIDLDGFKPVNDRYGHEAGDAVLRQVAARLKGALRAADLPARIGGDEFAVLLAHSDESFAGDVAAKLRAALAAPYDVGAPVRVSASIGIAMYPASGATADELMRQGDKAMYAAKWAARRAADGA